MGRGQGKKINLRSMYVTWAVLITICVVLLVISPMISVNQGYFAAQGVPIAPMISDGQFVWGPNVGNFDVAQYLESNNSPLLEFASDIQVWAAYTSVNPKVILTVLELRHQWISGISPDWNESEILDEIEAVSMDLATNFYDHMYSWGARSDEDGKKSLTLPSFDFDNTGVIQVDPETSSGSFAVASVLSHVEDQNTWENLVTPKSVDGFAGLFSQLFPDTDLLDDSNNLEPPGTTGIGLDLQRNTQLAWWRHWSRSIFDGLFYQLAQRRNPARPLHSRFTRWIRIRLRALKNFPTLLG
jgi:hypothetical protein